MADRNYKTKVVDGKAVCFTSEWIYDLEKEVHFSWYYYQGEIVYNKLNRGQKILEIGLGTGLISDMLKRRKWDIKTLDIDEDKHPDFCDSAVDFDYQKHGVQAVLAFEIFEHIPYSTFSKVIEKLSRSNVNAICFSLPWCDQELFSFLIKLPILPKVQWSLRVSKKKIYAKSHFWELSKVEMQSGEKKLISLETMRDLFKNHGYSVELGKKIGYIQYFFAKR